MPKKRRLTFNNNTSVDFKPSWGDYSVTVTVQDHDDADWAVTKEAIFIMDMIDIRRAATSFRANLSRMASIWNEHKKQLKGPDDE